MKMEITSPETPGRTGQLLMPRTTTILMLFVWIAAAIGIVLPFAMGTSPLDAILLNVPNNEGNWWHALVGLPFFLSIPMICLHIIALNTERLPSVYLRRGLAIIIIISAVGTLLVETPFLLHRAGTSELQRLEVIFSGMGMIITSGLILYIKRKEIAPVPVYFIGIASSYLGNAFLCLIMYSEAKFQHQSRSGWYLTIVIIWPILTELIWLLFRKNDD